MAQLQFSNGADSNIRRSDHMNKMKFLKAQDGFPLFEIIAVLIILGVLSAADTTRCKNLM